METFEFIILLLVSVLAWVALRALSRRVRVLVAPKRFDQRMVWSSMLRIGRSSDHPDAEETVVRFRMDPIEALDPSILDDVEYSDVTNEVNADVVD